MRLGCLPYLNVRPLVWTLEHGGLPADWELVYAPPAQLAEMLERGEIDAAPVSSFACFTSPELEMCPGICIAAHGSVKSVLMLSKKHVDNLDTVALDAGSLSGASMLRIILAEAYSVHPDFVRLPGVPIPLMLKQYGAALVIGDPAMLYPKDELEVLDVGEAWTRLTGLPAVFALWAGPQMSLELRRVLTGARQQGLSMLDEIARAESARLGLSVEECHDYLSNTICYDLGEHELLGLTRFRELAARHGLIRLGAGVEAALR